MSKQQLLQFVQDLPDNVEVFPFEYANEHDSFQFETPWKSHQLGIYRKSVTNNLTLKLKFTAEIEGEFLRTYTNQAGQFLNIHRIC
jgi:hypothetical protein